MRTPTILLVVRDPGRRRGFGRALAAALPWAACEPAADLETAWKALGAGPVDVAIAQDALPDGSGLAILRALHRRKASCILLAQPEALEAGLAAKELVGCLAEPVEPDVLVRAVAEALLARPGAAHDGAHRADLERLAGAKPGRLLM